MKITEPEKAELKAYDENFNRFRESLNQAFNEFDHPKNDVYYDYSHMNRNPRRALSFLKSKYYLTNVEALKLYFTDEERYSREIILDAGRFRAMYNEKMRDNFGPDA